MNVVIHLPPHNLLLLVPHHPLLLVPPHPSCSPHFHLLSPPPPLLSPHHGHLHHLHALSSRPHHLNCHVPLRPRPRHPAPPHHFPLLMRVGFDLPFPQPHR